jgi:hypothetical protein
MRYVPSTSNVPSDRTVGLGNRPWPHPTVRSQVSATARHAPSPVHRPVASGPSLGAAGFLLHAKRPAHAAAADVSNPMACRLVIPDSNAHTY